MEPPQLTVPSSRPGVEAVKNPAGPMLRLDLAPFLTDVKAGRISR
jgi:hypothetical protein